MPHYLHQVAYSREGWQALLAQPQDRAEAIRPSIEKLGGKVKSAWFAFGEYDVVVITEMPDNVSAAGIAMAFAVAGLIAEGTTDISGAESIATRLFHS